MRVPLPDISATEPSVFRIVIQTSSPAVRSTSSAPSHSGCSSYSSSATRYAFPCACQSDDVIRALDHNEAWNPSQPLALVRGVSPCADDDRLDRLLARKRCHLVEAERLPRRLRDGPGERCPYLVLDTRGEHRVRPLEDPPLELLLRRIEADDERRMPRVLGPEVVVGRPQGRSGLGQLEGANDPALVVLVDSSRRAGVELAEPRVRSGRIGVVGGRPAFPRTG